MQIADRFAPEHVTAIAVGVSIAYVGYALGKSDRRVNAVLAIGAIATGILLHAAWQLLLPHRGLDWIALTLARSPDSPMMSFVALIETAGIWIPVLVIRWAALRTRLWVAAYVVAAATLGSIAYFAAFDPPPEPHPRYGAWLLLAVVVAMVPFTVGCMVQRKERTVDAAADRRISG